MAKTTKRKPKQRVHREWFRTVSRGNRKSCPTCRAKLEAGEWIWSWGEYRYGKFRAIKDVCKACWPKLAVDLNDHTAECGCAVELEARGASRPAWMNLECTMQPKKVVLIKPDRTIEEKTLDFKGMQDAVGGYVESLRLADGVGAYVNGEVIGLGLEPNPLATVFCRCLGPNIAIDDHIKGTMVVLGAGGMRDVKPETVEMIKKLATEV